MPRPTHAQGRPATRVIPADWSATHAPVVGRALRGTCSVRVPGQTQEWDGTQMQAVDTAPYWAGPCRVQNLTDSTRARTVVEDREYTATHLVVLPIDSPAVLPGHLIMITTADGEGVDPVLAGAVLQVEHVTGGTERFERDLLCTLIR